MYVLFRGTFEVFPDFISRSHLYGIIDVKGLDCFVLIEYLGFPEHECIGIDAMKSIGLLSNDGFLEVTNSLFRADVDRKSTFVIKDPADQGQHVGSKRGLGAHSGLLVGFEDGRRVVKREERVSEKFADVKVE